MTKHLELFFQSDRTAYDLAIQRNVITFKYEAYKNEDQPGAKHPLWENFRKVCENLEAFILDRYFSWLATVTNTTPIDRDSLEAYVIYDQMSGFIDSHIPTQFLTHGEPISLIQP